MSRTRVGNYNVDTGEIMEGSVVVCLQKRRRNGFSEWSAVSKDAGLSLANSGLSFSDVRVMLALLTYLEYENQIIINQSEIAESLGMRPPHVSRSISRLVDAGFIIKGRRAGKSWMYRMSPEFAWKGSARNHVVALDEFRKSRA